MKSWWAGIMMMMMMIGFHNIQQWAATFAVLVALFLVLVVVTNASFHQIRISDVQRHRLWRKLHLFKQGSYVPIYVMMPLNTIVDSHTVNNPAKILGQLQQLKAGGVDGIMLDVWWGIVENAGPKQYEWDAYRQVFDMAQHVDLKVHVVMSFHQCGTNVGDACYIPLPSWVLNIGHSNPDIFYTDQTGHRDQEYLTSGVDHEPLFQGRTALDLYSDFMASFQQTFTTYLGTVVTGIEVGLGPAGEMRYPSYQLQDNIWSFPGVGAFQCYDKYLLARLYNASVKAGHPEWGHGGPNNAGSYNNFPDQVPFFSNGFDNWNSPYGSFFLDWYAQNLIDHGEAVLSRARKVFTSGKVSIAAKIAGIHWWYFTSSHAAELTAGYYNTAYHDGYTPIAKMFAQHQVTFDFTCLEMRDSEQSSCACGPEELVKQTQNSAWGVGISYSGENALYRTDQTAYSQIEMASARGGHTLDAFTFLRLDDNLLQSPTWNLFVQFVQNMHSL